MTIFAYFASDGFFWGQQFQEHSMLKNTKNKIKNFLIFVSGL